MKITMLTIGTYGDVQPYVALGIGLREAGIEVRLATHAPFRSFVEKHGLDFAAIEGDPLLWAAGEELKSLVEAGSSFSGWMSRLRTLAEPLLKSIFNSCKCACQGADAVIYSPLAWAGYSIAEQMNIPSFPASMQPFFPTRAFASAWAPQGINLGTLYNKSTHTLVERVFWRFNRSFVNRWREEALGLPPIPTGGPYKQKRWMRQQFLFAYSPAFLPRPGDWPKNVYVTGYWFLKPQQNWQPDAETIDFIQSGDRPVYIGFGSVPDRRPQELHQIILKVVAITGKRALILANTISSPAGRISDDVLNVGWMPHDWLFPRMSAIVHHGGASTVGESLRSGVPSVIVPAAWDQPFWGKRVAAMEVGPQPIPRKQLSANELANAIIRATEEKAMRALAGKLGEKIRNEDGVGVAANIIVSKMKKGG